MAPRVTTALMDETFSVNMTVNDVCDLYCYEFKLGYDNTMLYASEVTIQPFLNEPTIVAVTEINETLGRVWVGITSRAPVEMGVSGNGTLATITFRVIATATGSCSLDIYDSILGDSDACEMDHDIIDGNVVIQAEPKLEMKPGSISTFVGNVFDVDVVISIIEASAMLVGVEFKLRFDNVTLSVVEVTEGPFLKNPAWALSGTEMVLFIEEDYMHLGVLLLPHVDGEWATFPEGSGTLATITFNATTVGTSNLELFDTKLSNTEAENIPHETVDGSVTIQETPQVSPDVNGDGVVDLLDIVAAGLAFGSYPGHPRWNPVPDINQDNLIDIFDLVLIAINWGPV